MLELGELITVSQSAHIYEHCWKETQELIKGMVNVPKFNDPVGIFIVGYDGGKLTVEWEHDGRIIKTFKGIRPLSLIREISSEIPEIEASHIGYLGIELERARHLGSKYVQDRG
jgi:thymidylate synthase